MPDSEAPQDDTAINVDNVHVDQADTSPDRDESLVSETSAIAEDPESFPRDYVEALRDENAKYRQRARC